jgi:hypothetical protein
MTDKKLTDNEIIKALKELLKELKSKKQLIVPEQGVKNLCYGLQNFLDLINRQKEDIERLREDSERLKKVQMQLDDMCKMHNVIKSEAYKEFAERLKENSIATFSFKGVVMVEEIDDLLKELESEKQ